ncbi:MAG TPA: hypothetical protein VGZ48_14705 [Candidatus Acidoferrales bacterium]|jgi:hypothetical protein|nr:hypothetical protein [Candidatus Acidoferrales bacterium]
MTLDEALLSVWRQALEENLNLVELDGRRFPVRRTQRGRLRQVDFDFEGQSLRALEQNPETRSKWAELARGGQKVMQFLSGGRYIGNVSEGKLTIYRKTGPGEKKTAAAAAAPRSRSL